MACKTTFKPFLSLLILFFCGITFGFGQIITFDFDSYVGDEPLVNSNSNDENLSPSIITRGIGLTPDANADRFNAVNWGGTSISDAITNNDYMEFTITPNLDYRFNVNNIIVNFQRSAQGPNTIALRNSLDGYASTIDTEKNITVSGATTQVVTFTLSQPNISTPVTYRIYGWATSNLGTGGFEGPGNDIIVNGSVSAIPVCGAPVTWDGTAWDNGFGPDITTEAIINGDYDTSFD